MLSIRSQRRNSTYCTTPFIQCSRTETMNAQQEKNNTHTKQKQKQKNLRQMVATKDAGSEGMTRKDTRNLPGVMEMCDILIGVAVTRV